VLALIAAHLVLTLSCLAIAMLSRRGRPANATGVLLGVGSFIAVPSLAAVAYAGPYDGATLLGFAPLTVCALVALVFGVRRKMRDEGAPFATEPAALAIQSVAALTLLVTPPWILSARGAAVSSFACALIVGALARPSVADGAQALLSWRLDERRRAFDGRDPRRAIGLAAVLSAMASAPLLLGPDVGLWSVGPCVLGTAILLCEASLASVRCSDRRPHVVPVAVGLAAAVVLWLTAALSWGPESIVSTSCPGMLVNAEQTVPQLVIRTVLIGMMVAAAVLWAQRSFVRSCRVGRSV
jgi:hypothetical protein